MCFSTCDVLHHIQDLQYPPAPTPISLQALRCSPTFGSGRMGSTAQDTGTSIRLTETGRPAHRLQNAVCAPQAPPHTKKGANLS